jgi:uncharacterized surface protein with fasciclin (FAS1) repeats
MKDRLCFRAHVAPLLFVLFLGLIASPAEAKPSKIRDLADTVAANPILTKFASIIQASGSLETFLSSRGPFTLFVPTDAAFDKLPPGTLDTLLRPENQVRLQDILLFHLVNGKKLTAKDLFLLKSVLSCQGTLLPLRTTHSGVQLVLKAKIMHADIRCKNGIIHEIDTVLMPPESALPPIAPPPPPVPATNTPSTNAPSAVTNAVSVVPSSGPATNVPLAAPVAPSATPH